MSVTLDRFVRVMTGGIVVSQELVDVRYSKTLDARDAVKMQMARLTDVGLEPTDAFVDQLQRLEQQLAAAMQQSSNQDKCEALDTVKLALLDIAKETEPRVDEVLANAAAMRRMAAEAEAVIDQANEHIGAILDRGFIMFLATKLGGVRSNCATAATATRGPQIKQALTLLATYTSEAAAIVEEAQGLASLVNQRNEALAAVDSALVNLSNVNATITEAAHKAPSDRLLAALTAQRDAVLAAGPEQLPKELSRVGALKADIATALATTTLRAAWTETKARRDAIHSDADRFAAFGREVGVPALETAATKLQRDLTALEALSLTDPKTAADALPHLESERVALAAMFAQAGADSTHGGRIDPAAASSSAGAPIGLPTVMPPAPGTGLNPPNSQGAQVTSDPAPDERFGPTIKPAVSAAPRRVAADAANFDTLLEETKALIAANPDGPEAQLKNALGTDLKGKDLFEARLADAYQQATLLGLPELKNLSAAELVAIHSYTCGDYKQMNQLLLGLALTDYDRGEEDVKYLPMPSVDQVIIKNKQAIEALAKLPDRPRGITLRGLRQRYPGDDNDFKVGGVYQANAFWSSTDNPSQAFRGPWLFVIDSGKGKNVAGLSKYPEEGEVLYLPGTKFKVTRCDGAHVDADDLTRVIVYLEEVP